MYKNPVGGGGKLKTNAMKYYKKSVNSFNLPLHLTPASLEWPQSWFLYPLCKHSKMLRSLPLHLTLSSAMSTEPCPNEAPVVASLASPNPILLQTTWASFRSQSSSHTVPQVPLVNTSNLPAQLRRTTDKSHICTNSNKTTTKRSL